MLAAEAMRCRAVLWRPVCRPGQMNLIPKSEVGRVSTVLGAHSPLTMGRVKKPCVGGSSETVMIVRAVAAEASMGILFTLELLGSWDSETPESRRVVYDA